MMGFGIFVLMFMVSVLAVTTLTFVLQTLLGCGGGHHQQAGVRKTACPRIAVLVPAHNEAVVIERTLKDIAAQLGEHDRLVVIADNCRDDTALIAREYTDHVIERHDEKRTGKGYALHFGLQFLERSMTPDVVIMIDADCRLSKNCIEMIAQQAYLDNRPVQALDLMISPEKNNLNLAIAEFAWRVKNQVRALGLKRLGLPCQLMGTGMGFPWHVLLHVDLGHGNMVEDMKLGIDLAISGYPPVFCPSARVSSEFPVSDTVNQQQRRRWEHGHLATIFAEVPRLLKAAIRRRDIHLITMMLDLAVPPVTVLLLSLTGMLILTAALAIMTGFEIAFWLMLALFVIFGGTVIVIWFRFGRDILSLKTLFRVPGYIFRKMPLYFDFFIKRQRDWVKTERR